MINSPLKSSVLSMKIIPNLHEDMVKELNLPAGHRSIGLFTTDCDDVAYTALDEATKKADVKVVYGRSFYGGAANANTKLAGEIIGIISGPNPAEVRSGLDAICDMIENEAYFISANEDDTICYYAYCISRTGSYLSEGAGVPEGTPLAYLIAPPEEAVYGVDAALKAADVKLATFYAPPSETNFGGALLTGSQSACKAACNAFADAVKYVAANPTEY
jgi:ethanolamine utilization protein EutL